MLLKPIDSKNPDEIVSIVNPTSQDFTCAHDTNEDGIPIEYTVKSRQGGQFARVVADHIAHQLMQEIVGQKVGVITQEFIDKTLSDIKLYE